MATEREMELFTISSETPETRTLQKSAFSAAEEVDLQTEFGQIKVAIQGNRKKPAIITFHDIGLNHVTCFQGFFHFTDMQVILEHFCVYHVNAPGQSDDALPLLQGSYQYPNMDQLAEIVHSVVTHFNLRSIIGFGVGAGGNVLARFAKMYPKKCEAICLINPTSAACGWVEWGYQKWNSWYLKSGNLTEWTSDYLLWHWFGRATKSSNSDLVHVYSEYVKAVNPVNLALFIDSYCARTDLKIKRPASAQDNTTVTIPCQSMLVSGELGPALDDTIDMNSRMDPAKTTLVKLSDCGGMVLEEAPGRLAEAFRLFLQGLGYVPFLSQTKLVEERNKHRSIPTNPTLTLGSHSGAGDQGCEPGEGADDRTPMLA